MRKFVAMVLFLFLVCSVSMSAKRDFYNNYYSVEYLRNYDGDTIKVNIPNADPLIGEEIGIRLLGVDAPEIKTKNKCEKRKAEQAKAFVAKALKNAKKINLVNTTRDKYFRIVADIRYDGKSLGKQLLKRGLAYPYDGGEKSKINWCKVINKKK